MKVQDYVNKFVKELENNNAILRTGHHFKLRIDSTKDEVETLVKEQEKAGRELTICFREKKKSVEVYYIGLRSESSAPAERVVDEGDEGGI